MKKHKQKTTKDLRAIGWWATVWWGLSGLYLVWIFWLAKDYYAAGLNGASVSWGWALGQAYSQEPMLELVLALVMIGWAVIGIGWLAALKQAKIPYKDGLKDLFFTLR